ncbi:hypothetical protein EZV73_08580 [Acidaminobacter sp. JC074]|uniref:hypothetical protein n=1 Tax=Acidaminobacter sp. JC074 TaxID=2530199 RepID=UPI001F11610A|nr:hypothetical protein [Acidaminobacter sp. JC074]MCH4887626.1 hypothetical protein [Acidaminobacter sp. JC074]
MLKRFGVYIIMVLLLVGFYLNKDVLLFIHQMNQSDYTSYQGQLRNDDFTFDHEFDKNFHRLGLKVIGNHKLHLEILIDDKIYLALPELKDTFFTLDKNIDSLELTLSDYMKAYGYLYNHLVYSDGQFLLEIDASDLDDLSIDTMEVSIRDQFLAYGLSLPEGQIKFEKDLESFELDIWMGKNHLVGDYEIGPEIKVPNYEITDAQPLKDTLEEWVDALKDLMDYEG